MQKTSPTAKKGAIGSGAGAGRGRPKKDLGELADKYFAALKVASETDVLWFGTESKTQAKVIRIELKEVEKKLKTAADMEETLALQLVEKKFSCLSTFMDLVSEKGLQCEEFVQVSIPPAVNVYIYILYTC